MFIRGVGQVEIYSNGGFWVLVFMWMTYISPVPLGVFLTCLMSNGLKFFGGHKGLCLAEIQLVVPSVLPLKNLKTRFSGNVSILYGTDNQFIPKASFNVPLSDNTYLKVSGAYTTQDGYVEKANGQFTGDKGRFSGRAHLRMEVNDTLELNLIADITRERTNGAAFVLSDTNATGFYPTNPDGSPTPFPSDQKAARLSFFP